MSIKTAAEFRALARSIIESSASPEPSVVADKLLGELSATECRIALAVTLTDWVRVYSATLARAHRSIDPDRTEPAERDPLTGKPVGHARMRRIRATDWHAAALSERLLSPSGWKFLRDCTWQDLTEVAEARRVAAAKCEATAEKWQALADLMKRKKYATAAEVPVDALREILAVRS